MSSLSRSNRRVFQPGNSSFVLWAKTFTPGEANLAVVTEVEPDLEELVITDLVKLTDGIRPKALDCAVAIACKIGRVARRGKADRRHIYAWRFTEGA